MVTDAPSAPLPKLDGVLDSEDYDIAVRAMAGVMSECLILAGPNGQMLWHNPVTVRVFEMESADIVGRRLDDEHWRAIALDGSPYPFEALQRRSVDMSNDATNPPIGIRTGASRLKWFNFAVTPIELSGEPYTIVMLNEVTDQLSERRALTRTMESLRRGLAPSELPTSEVVRFAAGRSSGGAEPLVGADFYDVKVDGDIARFTLGDSVGSGAGAVGLSVMALASMRSVAGIVSGPAAAIERLDAVIDDRDPRLGATAVCGRIERPYGIVTLSLVCAGHALPILIRQGRATEIGSMSPMIGVSTDAGRTATRHELGSGDIVVAYTDGLTDSFTPRLTPEDLLERIPVNAPVEAVVEMLLRTVESVPDRIDGVAVLGFEVT